MLNVGINGKMEQMKNEGTGPAESFKTGERKRGVNGRKNSVIPLKKASLCVIRSLKKYVQVIYTSFLTYCLCLGDSREVSGSCTV